MHRPRTARTTIRLREAYERHLLPELERRVTRTTIEMYRKALNAWERHTDDPPIHRISNATLAQFRDAFMAGDRRPATFNAIWRHLRPILRRVAPPDSGNPLGEGVIGHLPHVRSLTVERRLPRIIRPGDLDAVYVAAAGMTWPNVGAVLPGEWWRAWLAVGLSCGPRLNDLMTLKASNVDLDERVLRFRARKTRHEHVIPLGDVVIAHLHSIWSDREWLFAPRPCADWAHNDAFYAAWNELLRLADVRDRFTPHSLRRMCGTLYFKVGGLELASFVLGHSARGTTMTYYVDPTESARHAADRIAWPGEFRTILDEPGESVVEARRRRSRQNWRFGVLSANYRGQNFTLHQRPHAILRALVAAGRPLTFGELAAAAWPDRRDVCRVTVKGAVHRLRHVLADSLSLLAGWDPIPFETDAAGWQLRLPDPEERHRATA